MEDKYVYMFTEGNAQMRELLGGKGANLAEMTNIGLPIPQGFIVSTKACIKYYDDGMKLSDDMIEEIYTALRRLEEITGKQFANPDNPLLLSIRSGARVSMPGMMDSILNLGLNQEITDRLIAKNERVVLDCYRRLIQMFGNVVKGIEERFFLDAIDNVKQAKGVKFDYELEPDDLRKLIYMFKEIYKTEVGEEFPEDPNVQLKEAIGAVFKSWNNQRAIVYRKANNIPNDWGTAVNVQEMVFGNMGDDSGTGVAFSRNPATGENKIFGEFLMNAQGEDIVSGVRTPEPIEKLQEVNCDIYNEFVKYAKLLEKHYKDMQDMEFTIENGKLFFLQTRNGKRTAMAALKIATDLVDEGMITEKEAILRVEPNQLEQLLHPTFNEEKLNTLTPIATGLPASPGAGYGKIVFSAARAKELASQGEKELILARLETSPEDIEGMQVCNGIITLRGGMTSHAAVVARGMGKCCIASCVGIQIDNEKIVADNGKTYSEGDYISLDGTTGKVYEGKIETELSMHNELFDRFMNWADKYRRLKVRVNADTPEEARTAYEFGAEGIGLCRTEHMFFEEERIQAIREMIVSTTTEQREKALAKLLPMQKQDFIGLYKEMKGYPVTIRLLDPPLHEFLPHDDEAIRKLSDDMGIDFETLKAKVVSLHEFNPMMGHRGCRIAISYPEIAKMQTRAIIEAAIEVNKDSEMNVVPEIMIPLVGDEAETKYVKEIIEKTADIVIAENNVDLKYEIGVMIEIPRAAILANEIARQAEFFSFGTNDLTQLTFGFSRDDSSKFLPTYYSEGIYKQDPFARVDEKGVGKLMKMAVDLGKQTRPDIKLGICGEHGGNPESVEFCHRIGLTYVSCSPFRVPIARLAAAQAAVKEECN